MKKSLSILFVLLFFSFSLIVSAASDPLGIGEQLDGVEGQIETFEGLEEEYTDQKAWENKWDVLGERWKEIFLKNRLVSTFDSLFTNLSFAFRILFGMDYSLSLILFAVMVLWFFIAMNSGKVIAASGLISSELSFFAGALLSIALAQITLLENIVLLLTKLIFAPEHGWTRAIVFIVTIVFFVFIQAALSMLSKYVKENKKRAQEHAADFAQKRIIKYVEKSEEAASAQ